MLENFILPCDQKLRAEMFQMSSLAVSFATIKFTHQGRMETLIYLFFTIFIPKKPDGAKMSWISDDKNNICLNVVRDRSFDCDAGCQKAGILTFFNLSLT